MRTTAELIKIGLEYFQATNGEPYMCFILHDMARKEGVHPRVTIEEYQSFRNWLREELYLRPSQSVLDRLGVRGLDDSEENWVQFYVWAYYDLIKRNTHEHQP